MRDSQNQEDSYGTEIGTPTLTLRIGMVEQIIPWAGFLGGVFRGKADGRNEMIELRFQECEVTLKGHDLRSLLEKCQLQDLRWIREIPDAVAGEWAGEGGVTEIRCTTPDDQGSEPPSGIH